MQYFKNCKCIEDVKETYKNLVLKLHPDNGGNMWDFIEMKNQYEVSFNNLKNVHRYTDEHNQEKYYEKDSTELSEEYAILIEILIKFANIKIELLGKWMWVSGNTKQYKDTLKSLGFKWSRRKQAWYNTFGHLSVSNKHTLSMNYDELRDHWQAQEVKKHNSKSLSIMQG